MIEPRQLYSAEDVAKAWGRGHTLHERRHSEPSTLHIARGRMKKTGRTYHLLVELPTTYPWSAPHSALQRCYLDRWTEEVQDAELWESVEADSESSLLDLVPTGPTEYEFYGLPAARPGVVAGPATSLETRRRFAQLAQEWADATGLLSSIQAKVMHPAYQSIMAMGPEALPLIFEELRERPAYWYHALTAITGQDPAANTRRMSDARREWLAWADENGY